MSRHTLHVSLWKLLRYPFPVWYCNHWLNWLHRQYERDRKQAQTQAEKEALWSQEQFEAAEYFGERETVRTRRLVAKARRLHISVEDLPIPSNQESHWQEGDFGHRYLSDRSQAAMYRAIWQARKEYWDFWLKITGAIIAALTGLVGATIGLLAFLTKKR
jgi:hypothetical protein